jgi:hypothetical protein
MVLTPLPASLAMTLALAAALLPIPAETNIEKGDGNHYNQFIMHLRGGFVAISLTITAGNEEAWWKNANLLHKAIKAFPEERHRTARAQLST